jgi:ATP-dependent DNA helicase RecG
VVRNGGQKRQPEINGRSFEIIALIKETPYISRKELSDKLGINGSAIQKYIVKLKVAGIIERIGADRGGYWRIIK